MPCHALLICCRRLTHSRLLHARSSCREWSFMLRWGRASPPPLSSSTLWALPLSLPGLARSVGGSPCLACPSFHHKMQHIFRSPGSGPPLFCPDLLQLFQGPVSVLCSPEKGKHLEVRSTKGSMSIGQPSSSSSSSFVCGCGAESGAGRGV